ncbi:unnamed protein product, partial [Symbiodinium sp. KB8]
MQVRSTLSSDAPRGAVGVAPGSLWGRSLCSWRRPKRSYRAGLDTPSCRSTMAPPFSLRGRAEAFGRSLQGDDA